MKQKMFVDIEENSDGVASLPGPGKDEMNFAEFPMALLTERPPKGQTLIRFEDQIYDEKRRRMVTRRRIIEGSEEYGLPTATDDTVMLALIQLTKLNGNFSRREVEFTRLELIKMLGWADEGRSYDRLKLSLQRIASVTYHYDNAWWDTRQKTWTTKIFHILETVEINDSRNSKVQGGLFPSRVVWNEIVFDSFQAGFLRDIDFQLCMRFQHPIALRMYRFLGKRFWYEPDLTFNLKEFTDTYIWNGRNYEGGTQIARKLRPAIEELERVGFLTTMIESERFPTKGRNWQIRFVQKRPSPAATLAADVPGTETPPAIPPLVAELTKRGVTKTVAAELVQRHAAATVAGKLEVFDWLVETKDQRIGKNPAGYLVKSIGDDYATPPGFSSAAERRQRQDAKAQGERDAAEERRRKQLADKREREQRLAVDAYLKTLSQAARESLEAEALAAASPELRDSYQEQAMKVFRTTLMKGMLLELVGPRLTETASPDAEQ